MYPQANQPGFPQGYTQPQTQAQPQGQPVAAGAPGVAPAGVPAPAPASAAPSTAQKHKNLVEIVIIIVLGFVAATFIGLFIWMYVQYDDVKTDVDGQIAVAVAQAVNENTTELQEQFAEQEKSPYETFTGPTEYGSLSFEYPKTWSVYIAEESDDGGDYVAYFHPEYVYPVSNDQIYALRMQILSTTFDRAISNYTRLVERGSLTMSVIQINDTSVNYYVGTLPNGFVGRAVAFRLRDKTVILQTDAELYADDFETLLESVTFNQ